MWHSVARSQKRKKKTFFVFLAQQNCQTHLKTFFIIVVERNVHRIGSCPFFSSFFFCLFREKKGPVCPSLLSPSPLLRAVTSSMYCDFLHAEPAGTVCSTPGGGGGGRRGFEPTKCQCLAILEALCAISVSPFSPLPFFFCPCVCCAFSLNGKFFFFFFEISSGSPLGFPILKIFC